MGEEEKDNTTWPVAGSTEIKQCKNCGAERKRIFKAEEKQYMAFLKREMVVDHAHWEWEKKDDPLYDGNELPSNGDGVCSACLKKEKEIARKKELEQAQKQMLDEKIKALGGELNFKKFTLEKYDALSPSQVEAYKACMDFDPTRNNLFLLGAAGVGKSHLATAVMNAHYKPGSKRYRITELLRLFRIKRAADEEQSLIDEFSTCPVLIIEDFGVQKTTDWAVQMWWEILDRRIESGQNGLIITSNTGRKKIAEEMGDKISSRMSGLCRVIKIEGLDLRVTEKPDKR